MLALDALNLEDSAKRHPTNGLGAPWSDLLWDSAKCHPTNRLRAPWIALLWDSAKCHTTNRLRASWIALLWLNSSKGHYQGRVGNALDGKDTAAVIWIRNNEDQNFPRWWCLLLLK